MLTLSGHFACEPRCVSGPRVFIRPRPVVVFWAGPLVVTLISTTDTTTAETFDGRRAVIIDGDTIALGPEHIRILNIDAPLELPVSLGARVGSGPCKRKSS